MHGTRQGKYRVRIREKISLEVENLEDRLNSILAIGENSPGERTETERGQSQKAEPQESPVPGQGSASSDDMRCAAV